MSTGILKYRKYLAAAPGNTAGSTEKKWYARAVQDRTLEFEDFVSHIANHNSPYSRGVISGVLTDMLDCLKELVLDGKSVRLGDLGLFSVKISSKGADTADQWSTSMVTGVRLNVRNTKTWSNAELRKNCNLSELTAYNVGTDGSTSGDGGTSGSGGESGGESGGDGGSTGGNPLG